jgi:hypothetical protein
MTAFRGAAPEQLRELGAALSSRSTRITELFDALAHTVLDPAHWSGRGRGGIAREYNLLGASSSQHSEGSIP